jgi:hypothetical protein
MPYKWQMPDLTKDLIEELPILSAAVMLVTVKLVNTPHAMHFRSSVVIFS